MADKYRRIDKPQEQLPSNELRVKRGVGIGRYLKRAHDLLTGQEGGQAHDTIVIKGVSNAVEQAVKLAELIKHRIKGLHQINRISHITIVDEYEPLEEGLDELRFTRIVTMLEIQLSKKELDTSDIGYQAPISESEVLEYSDRQKVLDEDEDDEAGNKRRSRNNNRQRRRGGQNNRGGQRGGGGDRPNNNRRGGGGHPNQGGAGQSHQQQQNNQQQQDNNGSGENGNNNKKPREPRAPRENNNADNNMEGGDAKKTHNKNRRHRDKRRGGQGQQNGNNNQQQQVGDNTYGANRKDQVAQQVSEEVKQYTGGNATRSQKPRGGQGEGDRPNTGAPRGGDNQQRRNNNNGGDRRGRGGYNNNRGRGGERGGDRGGNQQQQRSDRPYRGGPKQDGPRAPAEGQ